MYKYRAEITKGIEIRYISHLDYAAVMERAIRRAKLPAAYSTGFNPHIKIAFASALSLGVISDGEYMDFELTKPLCQPEVFERLSRELPPGVKLLRLKQVHEPPAGKGKKHKALMAEVDEGEYELTLPIIGYGAQAADCSHEASTAQSLTVEMEKAKQAVVAYNQAKEAFVHRITPKTDKLIDSKQYLRQPVQLSVADGQLKLYMDIAITQSGSVKPGEILELLQKEYGLPGDAGQVLIKRLSLKGKGQLLIDLV